MTKKVKKYLLLIVKLTVAAALLVWVLKNVEWAELGTKIRSADVPLLLIALCGFVVSLVIIGIRCWYLLRFQGISISLWEMIRLTFLGQFFNAVVPGTVGGDLVKAYYASKHTTNKGAAIITVFVDRLIGLTELSLLAATMIFVVWTTGLTEASELHNPTIAVCIALSGVGGIVVFLFSRRVRRLLHLEQLYRRLSIGRHIDAAATAVHRFREHFWILILAFLTTLVSHAIWIGSIATIGKSLSIEIPWYSYSAYIPLIYIIGAIPVTPGGLGLVETLYPLFFASALVTQTELVGLMFLVRSFDILRGLPGIVVVITGTKLPKTKTMEAELGMEASPALQDPSNLQDQKETEASS